MCTLKCCPVSVVLSGSHPPLETLVLFLLLQPGQSVVQQVLRSCSPVEPPPCLPPRRSPPTFMVRLWTLVQMKSRPTVCQRCSLSRRVPPPPPTRLFALATIKSHFDISQLYCRAAASARLPGFASDPFLWFWTEREQVATHQLRSLHMNTELNTLVPEYSISNRLQSSLLSAAESDSTKSHLMLVTHETRVVKVTLLPE